MANEWRRTTIGELCDAGHAHLQTGPFGSELHAHDYISDGVPIVPTEAIRDRRINHTVLPKVSTSKSDELSRHRLIPGDILFARRGVQATGHIGYVREPENGFLCGTGAILLRVSQEDNEIDPEFLSHVFANPDSVEWFKFHAIGATMPNLNEGIIRSFPLCIPSLPEQHAIAHILSTLDDKIELNRRMNETLEAVARAIFKSWFVDFDPVRAKAEGRDTGLPPHIADLFPDSFEDSELGEIPAGWRVAALSEVVEFAYGKALKDTNRRQGSIPVYGSNGQVGWHDESLVGGPGIVVGRKGNPGTVTWVPTDFFPIDTTFYVLSKTDGIGLRFLYFSLGDQHLASLSADSAVPGLNRNLAYMSPLLVPPSPVLRAFENHVQDLLERRYASDLESKILEELRDVLLPKLISGELRVGDVND